MSDLTDFIPQSETVTITIMNPKEPEVPLKNMDGTDMTVEVYRESTGIYKHAIRDVVNTKLKEAKEATDKASEEETFQRAYNLTESSTVDLYTKITKSWNITYGGEMPEFSFEKAREVYSQAVFLRDEIDKGLREDTGFTKA